MARNRLLVRPGGSITGTIRYGNIVIESGGEISGDMQSIEQTGPADQSPDDGIDNAPGNEPAQAKKKSSSTKK